jgi:hypothetical protein
MLESPATPEEDPRPESGSFYLYPLRLDDGTTSMEQMSRDELLCRVYETVVF